MKLSVVTTFHEEGLQKYGQRMIDSFSKNWPKEVTLYVYAEDCVPNIPSENIVLLDLHKSSQPLVSFKNKWKNVPKANGIPPDEIKRRRKDWNKTFKWDAVRFSHKVYSIFHCAKHCNSDVVMWMDADTYCHSPITMEEIKKLIPLSKDICYVGRENKWPECGLWTANLNKTEALDFLEKFQWVYDNAEEGIFRMEEWHDSFVFEEVRKQMNLDCLNWAAGLVKGEGHPLINSAWGAYIDHLKGDRKETGKSKQSDLLKPRTEIYWRQ